MSSSSSDVESDMETIIAHEVNQEETDKTPSTSDNESNEENNHKTYEQEKETQPTIDKNEKSYEGEWIIKRKKKKIVVNENVSILDCLTEMIQAQKVVAVDQRASENSLRYLRQKWNKYRFLRVKRVVGLGQVHIIQKSSRDDCETYMTEKEYDKLYNDPSTDPNLLKSITKHYEFGYYGWATYIDVDNPSAYDPVYFHVSNYAQIDFGIDITSNKSDQIYAPFIMNMSEGEKTPQCGDYICAIVGQSTRYKNKEEASPFFVSSETLYRMFMCILRGQTYKIFKGNKSEARLAASMICNGNQITNIDKNKIMTPFNCETIAIKEHCVYMTIVMVLVLKRRFKFPNLFTCVPPVGNLEYWEFILNVGDLRQLEYLNNKSLRGNTFDNIKLRHYSYDDMKRKEERVERTPWGDCEDYAFEDIIYPPMTRGRQIESIVGQRYAYENNQRKNKTSNAFEAFNEERRYDYGVDGNDRAFYEEDSNAYYRGNSNRKRKNWYEHETNKDMNPPPKKWADYTSDSSNDDNRLTPSEYDEL